MVHPLEVVHILAEMKLDVVCLAAGMLHDVVEDTGTTRGTIETEFGAEVARIVEGVTRFGPIKFLSREEQQAENFRKMVQREIEAMARATMTDERAKISSRIPKRDLARLKSRALQEGIPYQTLINALIHRYVSD